MPDTGALPAREIDALSTAFGDAVTKLVAGNAKYGPSAFLRRDTTQDIKEEILDAINYLCFLYYKVLLWEERLDDAGSADSTD